MIFKKLKTKPKPVQNKPADTLAKREILCDRIVNTAEVIHAMLESLRQEGGNEALLKRAEIYFECAFLAAGWSLDVNEGEGDDIELIM